MSQKVRVRFAPSPTGPLHIGGVRTALFNYLFAKKHGGDFVLRIEDTDQTRYVAGAEDYIVEALNWLNIPFDEGPSKPGDFGPYRQSERKGLYRQYADQLIAENKAYYAFDTSEELTALRSAYEAKKETFIYNWHNRLELNNSLALSSEETTAKIEAGVPFVIRFKSPQDETLQLQDMIRGAIQIDTNVLDDKVLFKSDGMPTYHLANIVDDHLMEISHVIRGEEWLPSLALHQQLYDAFGWNAPKFAHLSLILKPNGKGKLSKRDGDAGGFPVFPIQWNTEEGTPFSGYRENGYLPEAVVNMLAFLGWNPGTEQELFSLKELTESFSLERVNKAGPKFDPDKARWFQNQYLQQLDEAILVKAFADILAKKNILPLLDLAKIVGLVKERATFIEDLWEQGSFFFETPVSYNEKASKKAFKEDTPQILSQVVRLLDETQEFKAANISENIKFNRSFLDFHPNGIKFEATLRNGKKTRDTYYSIGGGFVVQQERARAKRQVEKFNSFPFPISKATEILAYCTSENLTISELVLKNELSLRDPDRIDAKIKAIWDVMLDSMYVGCHTEGTLPGGLNVRRRAYDTHQKLKGTTPYKNAYEWIKAIRDTEVKFRQILKWVTCFALAVNEVNASLGRVVTAPTNGSAGVIPAVLMYYLVIENHDGNFEDIKKFLLVSGEIGSLFKKNATISAAMGGCQAEIGVSSAMAAAALTELMGGSPAQVLIAAEIAMEHHLGLTCDPIAGLVQIPCIERNAMGAIKAINACEMALDRDPKDVKIPLDKVIATMWETAKDMTSKYKETSEGGLAVQVNMSDC